MRSSFALAALCGCSRLLGFESPQTADAFEPERDTPGDLAGDGGLASCFDDPDPLRITCLDFEGTFTNAVPNAGDPLTSGVGFVSGRAGLAARFTTTSSAVFANAPIFDVEVVTIEVWIQPAQLPVAGGRMGIWDTQAQYGMFLLDGGVSCRDSNASLDVAHPLVAGAWTHLACVADGMKLTMFVDGVEVGNRASAPLSFVGMDGPALGMNSPSGENFDGALDLLRLYRYARTREQICSSAGCQP